MLIISLLLFSPRYRFHRDLAVLISQEDRRALVQALLTDVKNDRFPADGK